MNYRKLKPEDSAQYRDIRLECLKNHRDNFGTTYEEESSKAKLPYQAHIEQQARGEFIVGAYDGTTLVGICGFHQETRKKTKHFGTIIQMYVQPDYNGKGVGRDLLRATIKEAFKISEIEQVILSVVAENKGANKLYESIGFQEYGMIKNYFKDGATYYDQRFMVLFKKDGLQ